MQPMWCYAGNPVDLDDTDWRITPVDTNAKDSLNPEALQVMSLGLLLLRRVNRDALGKITLPFQR